VTRGTWGKGIRVFLTDFSSERKELSGSSLWRSKTLLADNPPPNTHRNMPPFQNPYKSGGQ